DHPRPRLAEGERLGAAALHLPHEEDPDADEQEHRHPLQQDAVPGVRVRRLHRDADAALLERLDELRVLDDVGALGLRRVLERVLDEVAADGDGVDLALVDGLEELREVRLFLAALLRALENREQEDDDEADHHPEGKVLVDLIHTGPLIIAPASKGGAARQIPSSAATYGRLR